MKKATSLFVQTLIIILLSINLAAAQDQPETDFDAPYLIIAADSLFNADQYEKAREWYMQAAEKAETDSLNSELTEANAMIARTYLVQGYVDEGMEYLRKTLQTATPDDPMGWSRYLSVRGRFEWNNGTLDKATETFKEMFYYCQEHELWDRAVDAAHMVAITSDLPGQVEWAHKGIEVAEKHEVTSWLGPLWNNLGATYEDLEQYPEALQAYKKAREYHYKYGSERNKLIADWAVGHAYRKVDSLEQAENILRPLVSRSEELDEQEFLGWTYWELGRIEFWNRNYMKAAELIREARDNLKEAGIGRWNPEKYKEIVAFLERAKIRADEERERKGE
ncbi:MAG TPA: hypothetical protein ENO22_03825 [candidate division Zixibacteria bacterium]|nr:hypothetical protein [candidate division Zixibacteria bacterium]